MTPGTGRLATAGVAAVGARSAYALLLRAQPGGSLPWARVNHRGEPVTLLEGPAALSGAVAGLLVAPRVPGGLRAAGLAALLVSGVVGGYDDLAGSGARRGLRAHLGALAQAEVTTGAVKVAGIGSGALVAGALLHRDLPTGRAGEVMLTGALVAGTANLLNLLDLRPGRALKCALLAAPLALSAHPAGALAASACASGAALLPEDLGERGMLGDGGANALGALLGLALAARLGARGRRLVVAALVGLTLASEWVSFTRVIECVPVLRALDALGRRPPA